MPDRRGSRQCRGQDCVELFVLSNGDRWTVTYDGVARGNFDYQVDAEEASTRAFAQTCTRRKLAVGSPHDVRRSGATTLTGRYGVSRFVVGLVLGHTPNEGAAVTSVYDRHTYVPEKRAALELWANHLIRSGLEIGEPGALPDPAAGTHVDEAKARAFALCQRGELHEAVLSICMDLSRHPATVSSHLAILGKAGLERAAAGPRPQVEDWISGFRWTLADVTDTVLSYGVSLATLL